MDEIIQLKITLESTEPPIWRRVLVEKQITFFELHNIIQIAMGWENYHMFEFTFNKQRIGEPDDEFDDLDFGSNKVMDAAEVTLESIVTNTKGKISYVYDFGDNWSHKILVEKFLPRDNKISYPICTDGELNCPPEDCGGIPGFYDLLEVIGNKKHPERKAMLDWLGGSYDPAYFDKDEVNEEMKNLDQYISEWTDDE